MGHYQQRKIVFFFQCCSYRHSNSTVTCTTSKSWINSVKIKVSSPDQSGQPDFLSDLLGDYILLSSFKPNFPKPYLEAISTSWWVRSLHSSSSSYSPATATGHGCLHLKIPEALIKCKAIKKWEHSVCITLKQAFSEYPSTTSLQQDHGAGFLFWGEWRALGFPEMIRALVFPRSKGMIFVLFLKLGGSHDEMIFQHYITTIPTILPKRTTHIVLLQHYRTMYF